MSCVLMSGNESQRKEEGREVGRGRSLLLGAIFKKSYRNFRMVGTGVLIEALEVSYIHLV